MKMLACCDYMAPPNPPATVSLTSVHDWCCHVMLFLITYTVTETGR